MEYYTLFVLVDALFMAIGFAALLFAIGGAHNG